MKKVIKGPKRTREELENLILKMAEAYGGRHWAQHYIDNTMDSQDILIGGIKSHTLRSKYLGRLLKGVGFKVLVESPDPQIISTSTGHDICRDETFLKNVERGAINL